MHSPVVAVDIPVSLGQNYNNNIISGTKERKNDKYKGSAEMGIDKNTFTSIYVSVMRARTPSGRSDGLAFGALPLCSGDTIKRNNTNDTE